jgi:hypothetical protein
MKPVIKVLGAVALLFVAACSHPTITQTTSGPNYAAQTPIRLNAVKIEVVSEYTPRGSAPGVDHMMDRSPQQALVEWAKGRLRASGTSGYVQVKVKDASVTSRMLETEGGISGYFTREQSEELVARLSVDISGDQRDQNFSGYTTVEASQVATVPEKSTKAERTAIENDLVNKLIQQFNEKAESGVVQHLGPMVVQR